MKLELQHSFYQSPKPGTPMKSSFTLLADGSAVGQSMTEKQARQVVKYLGFAFPAESTLRQWTLEIE